MDEQTMEAQVRADYQVITKTLIEKKLTITTMESCTAGLIAGLLTDTEGASAVLKGAFVTYSNEAKILQGVPEAVIDTFGVYSVETAAAMAKACKGCYGADIGIGITGTFGNTDPNNPDSREGEVCYAIATGAQVLTKRVYLPHQPSRFAYKLLAARFVAEDLRQIL